MFCFASMLYLLVLSILCHTKQHMGRWQQSALQVSQSLFSRKIHWRSFLHHTYQMKLSLNFFQLQSEAAFISSDSQGVQGKMLGSFKHVRMLGRLTQPVKPVESHKKLIAEGVYWSERVTSWCVLRASQRWAQHSTVWYLLCREVEHVSIL